MYKIFILFVILVLVGCNSHTAPDCPYSDDRTVARSAGCFSVNNGRLLLIQQLNGAVSVPGGSSEPQESAQCTAYRETWEETGLKLQPKKIIHVYENGFHLYQCERTAASGAIDPPPRMEVRTAFYLSAEDFDKYEWRFPGQKKQLKKLLNDNATK